GSEPFQSPITRSIVKTILRRCQMPPDSLKSTGGNRLLLAGCLILSCLLALSLGWKKNPAVAPSQAEDNQIQGLSVDRSALDLGEVWEEKEYQCTLPIENSTSHDIKVLDFAFAWGFASVVPQSLTIPVPDTRSV